MLSRCVPSNCRQARVASIMHFLDRSVRCPFLQRQVSWSRRRRRWCSSWTSCSRPSLCNDRCRSWSGKCATLGQDGDMPVVGPHGPYSAEARGASTGAVPGGGCGHYDRCRGPDSVNCLEVPQFRSCSSKVVDIPQLVPSSLPRRPMSLLMPVQKTVWNGCSVVSQIMAGMV